MKLMRNLQAGDVTNCVVHISAIAFDFIGRTVKKKKKTSFYINLSFIIIYFYHVNDSS